MTEEASQKNDAAVKNPCIVPKEWNIFQRINWVRSQVSYVQKDAKVSNQYNAVRHDAVTASLRRFLVEAGIDTSQSLKSSKTVDSGSTTAKNVPIIRYEAVYVVTLTNIDNPGDFTSVDVEAHALDHGDKAPGKAMSYGVKYVFLKRFNIETGEDEESRIEQKAAQDMEAEKEAFFQQQLNTAIAQHMDSIQVVKMGIKEALPEVDKKTKRVEFGNESALTTAIEAWDELDESEQRSIWVAPSKGGPFSTDERLIIKSDRWAELARDVRGL